MAKVIEIKGSGIKFDNRMIMTSEHVQDCCEHHELTFNDLTLQDFEGLEFDLSSENFFKRIPGYGIELVPLQGYSVKIPGHGYNNGYYGTNIDLILYDENGGVYRCYDVSECQIIDG